jgi:hypothetical protein
MRSHAISLYIVLMGASALLISACAAQKTAPDPARIEREIAEAKAGELDLVRSTIPEPGRAGRFIDLLAVREQLLHRYSRQISEHRERMWRLNADYDAERAEFETLLDDYNRARAAAQRELIDLIAEMKQTTTADEWRIISAFQVKRLNPRQLAYSGAAGGN